MPLQLARLKINKAAQRVGGFVVERYTLTHKAQLARKKPRQIITEERA